MYITKELYHQEGVPATIPKDPIDDHRTYTVRKIYKYCNSLLYLLPLQRNQHFTVSLRLPL